MEPAHSPAPDAHPHPELSERDRAILAFESQPWRIEGLKANVINAEFGLSVTRYYAVLNALLDNPAAMAHDPLLVRRLLRLRASRARSRSAKRLPR